MQQRHPAPQRHAPRHPAPGFLSPALLALLAFTAPLRAEPAEGLPPGLYAEPRGGWGVESAKLELRDAARDKTVPLRVTWPKALAASRERGEEAPSAGSPSPTAESPAGKFPVIVFSHGAGGSAEAYDPLIECWASHGYVVIQPTHGDSLSLLSAEERREFKTVQEFLRSPRVLLQAAARPEDIRLVLDSLGEVEEEVPSLRGKLDPDRLGMGGHSYGAHTTQLIAGLTLKGLLGRRRRFEDPRPRALLAISPQGTGRAIDAESFSAMRRPMMLITGSEDDSPTGQPAAWRLEAWKHLPAGDKFLLFLEGAQHNFGGISGARYPGAGPDNPEHVAHLQAASLAFWDAYLRELPAARDYLAGDRLREASGGKVYLERKNGEAR